MISTPAVRPLTGPLTIREASGLHRELLAWASVERTLCLDLSQVTEIDGAGLQLLLAATRALEDLGGRLHLEAVPPDVDRAVTQAGGWPHLHRTERKDA